MSRYDELCQASKKSVEDWEVSRQRCWDHLRKIVEGFLRFTDIPPDKITYRRWNGIAGDGASYSPAEKGKRFSIPLAAVRSPDRFWHLCVNLEITLNVFFVIAVSDENETPLVRVTANGTPRPINIEGRAGGDFYKDISDRTLESFRSFDNPTLKAPFGFNIAEPVAEKAKPHR